MKKTRGQKALPVVAIVGRPNVGKSTLFNRLTGRRRAITDGQPGVTRDRNYGLMDWVGYAWAVIDTGGFEPSGRDILAVMRVQAEMAVEEAEAIIFMMDAKQGVTHDDHEVARRLRKQNKPVFFAVNKVDAPQHEEKIYEFYELGVERIFPLSAEHGHGVDELLDALLETVPGVPEDELENEAEGIPRIAVAGKPNVGKSTLINALAGDERLLVHEAPGTTRDAVDSVVELGGKRYLFVDTAGMRKKSRVDTRVERFSVMRSLSAIERCHLTLLMMDANEGVVDQDAKIAGLASDRGRAMILVFNKWDLVKDQGKRRAELEGMVKNLLPHADYAPILTVSAKEGVRLDKLPGLIEQVLSEFNKRIGTGELNRELEKWVSENPPPSGKVPVKIYYATQTAVRPPWFVFFTNKPDRVPEHYRRYLKNRIRDSFGFAGCPVRVSFRPRRKKG